jgi:3-hydroxymyristoyl/3-hydroxydecanoyl-(acyl carrier protein) dehydratase
MPAVFKVLSSQKDVLRPPVAKRYRLFAGTRVGDYAASITHSQVSFAISTNMAVFDSWNAGMAGPPSCVQTCTAAGASGFLSQTTSQKPFFGIISKSTFKAGSLEDV